jgi:hypothetical protein
VSRAARPVIALLVLLAACGPESAPSASPDPTAVPEPTPTVTTHKLSVEVWYAGFVLAFDEARATFDPRGGIVDIDGRLENPGPDEAPFESPIRLTAGGLAWAPEESDLPLVPPQAGAAFRLHFVVDRPLEAASLILRVGRPADQQAIVPFEPRSPDGPLTVSLEPAVAALDGLEVEGGALRLSLTDIETRWDVPDWRLPLPLGVALVTIRFDATYTGSFAGGFALTAANLRARLRDGTLVAPRPDGRSQPIVLLEPGLTASGLVARFEVPADSVGLGLVVIDGSASGAADLWVPPHGP